MQVPLDTIDAISRIKELNELVYMALDVLDNDEENASFRAGLLLYCYKTMSQPCWNDFEKGIKPKRNSN